MSEESCNEHFNETKKLFPDFILVTHLKKDTCHKSSLNIGFLDFMYSCNMTTTTKIQMAFSQMR